MEVRSDKKYLMLNLNHCTNNEVFHLGFLSKCDQILSIEIVDVVLLRPVYLTRTFKVCLVKI